MSAGQDIKQPNRFPFFKVAAAVGVGIIFVIGLVFEEGARKRRAEMTCIAYLKQIDGAAKAWALENKKAPSDTYSLTEPTMLAYLKGSALPICPLGGTYSPGSRFYDVPKCSIPGHQLLYKTSMGGYPR